MKGILFNEYGDLYRCSFDDDKRSGKPSIMLITQGLPVKRLEEFDNDQDLSGLNYRLLCLNGEPASSITVAMLLGTVIANPVGYVDDDMRRSLAIMQRLKVECDKEPLCLHFSLDSKINIHGEKVYSFTVSEPDTEVRVVDEVSSDDMYDLFTSIHAYLGVLQMEAEVPIASVSLYVKDDLLEEIEPSDKKIFNIINGQKQN
jgi:hypothetical protein